MIDKDLLKKRFKQSLKTYDNNALIQNQMGLKLIRLLPTLEFDRVFEFGSGTANFTKIIKDNLKYKELFLNDIVEDSNLWAQKTVSDFEFISGDVEKIDLPDNLDLITSNATIQWVQDVDKLLEKFSNSSFVAFTTFGQDNFNEIKSKFGVGLSYLSMDQLSEKLSKHFEIIHIEEEKNTLQFRNFRELLSHIKSTGVNCFDTKPMNKSDLLSFKENNLTYHSIYVVAKKKD